MEEEPSASSIHSLPLNLLTRAFKQLGQMEMLHSIPLVCQLWHQLAIDCCSSLDIQLETAAAAGSLIAWIRRHPSVLVELSVKLLGRASLKSKPDVLLQVLSAASQLRSLRISGPAPATERTISITGCFRYLPALRHVELVSVAMSCSNFSSLMRLSQLRSLSLVHCGTTPGIWGYDRVKYFGREVIPAIASSLTGLTSLDLSHSWWHPSENFSPLTALAKLVQLRIEGPAFTLRNDVVVRLPPTLPLKAVGLEALAWQHMLQHQEVTRVLEGWLQPLLLEKLDTLVLSHKARDGEKLLMPELFAVLAKSGPQLRSLCLEGIQAHGEVGQLAVLTQLTQLQLESCGVHNSEVAQLSALTGLRSLSLADNKRVKGRAGSFSTLATTLQQLTVMRCHEKAGSAMRGAFGDRILASRSCDSTSTEYRLSVP